MTESLFRPSLLARFWELHPRTVHEWIRVGRLASVRTPGNQYRLRAADVRAFCAREGMPVPAFVWPAPKRVLLVGGTDEVVSAVRRALKARGATLDHADEPYAGLVSAVLSPPIVVAFDARAPRFSPEQALAAIAAAAMDARPRVVVFDVATSAKCAALVDAGAAAAIVRARRSHLASTLAELV